MMSSHVRISYLHMWVYHIFTCEDIVSFLSICYHSVYHWLLYNKTKYSHFCHAARWSLVMYIEMFWLLTARLFIRRWGLLINMHHLLSKMLHCDWLVFSSFGWCTSIFTLSVCSSLSGQLSHSSPVVVFLDCWHPCFQSFYCIIPVDVVRVKSHVLLWDLWHAHRGTWQHFTETTRIKMH